MEYDRWVGRGEVSRQQCERLSALKQEPLPITLLAIAIRCTGVARVHLCMYRFSAAYVVEYAELQKAL